MQGPKIVPSLLFQKVEVIVSVTVLFFNNISYHLFLVTLG